jgi:hypothetical protein
MPRKEDGMKAVSKCLIVVLVLMAVSSVSAQGGDLEIAWYGKTKDVPGKIWLMESDGSNPIYVYEPCGPPIGSGAIPTLPEWSPDGRSLIITQINYEDWAILNGVFRLDLADPPTQSSMACPEDIPPQIIGWPGRLAAQGTAFPELDGLIYEGADGNPKWSPRGDEVALRVWADAFELNGDGYGHYVVVVADPSNTCNPPPGTCQDLIPIYHRRDATTWGFDWSPDGTELLIFYSVSLGNDEWRNELAIINRESGDVRDSWTLESVTPAEVGFMNSPVWAPTAPEGYVGPVVAFGDLFSHGRGNRFERRIYLLDLGVENPMAEQIGLGSSPAWSPDGRFLAVRGATGAPERIEVATGAVVELGFPWKEAPNFRSPSWKPASTAVCPNDICEGGENQCNCAADCGAYPSTEVAACTDFVDNDCDTYVDCDDSDCSLDPVCAVPYCGDGNCDENESQCSCPEDCEAAPFSETHCSDSVDNDCDELIDCDDPDCTDDASCVGGLPGDPCASGADCASGRCHPKQHVCK